MDDQRGALPIVALEDVLDAVGRVANRRRLTLDEEQTAKTLAWLRWRRCGGRVARWFVARTMTLRALSGRQVPGMHRHSQPTDVFTGATMIHLACAMDQEGDRRGDPARIAADRDLIRSLLTKLSERDGRILMRLLAGDTQQEAGKPEGLGKRRVSQIQASWRQIVVELCTPR